jgi:ATP phosphoribosyltransferase regulatory subunit
LPFLSPGGWRAGVQQLLQMQDGQIRFFGLCSMLIGLLLLLWLMRPCCGALARPSAGKIRFNSPSKNPCPPGSCRITLPMSCPPRPAHRRAAPHLLDTARSYGYELVMPPLLEHLESLLTGTGEALDLQTFKLVDQLSGRMLGVRADTTPQVARIDAHLLNRRASPGCAIAARCCTRGPDGPHATREPLQLGAEIYGHAGLEADLEDPAAGAGLPARPPGAGLCRPGRRRIVRLAGRRGSRAPAWPNCMRRWPPKTVDGAAPADGSARQRPARPAGLPNCTATRRCAGCRTRVPCPRPVIAAALDDLKWWPATRPAHPDVRWASIWPTCVAMPITPVPAFAVYAPGAGDALVRGGRYDEVGAVFGRNRPAVGFQPDLKNAGGPAAARAAAGRHPRALGRRCPRCASRAPRCAPGRNRGLHAARPRQRSR